MISSKIAQKSTIFLGYFCKQFFCQEQISKITQSGHTIDKEDDKGKSISSLGASIVRDYTSRIIIQIDITVIKIVK